MKQIKSLLVSIILLGSFSLLSCHKNSSTAEVQLKEISSSAYADDWEEIDKMENKGLGKSIIQKTEEILQKALGENNAAQVFKAMAYRSKYQNEIEEESSRKILNQFEEQIRKSETPLKELLHSATADLYFQYYIRNRWKLRSRTNSIASEQDDIRTWSQPQIFDRLNWHYKKSLENQDQLLKYPIQLLKEIYEIKESDNDSEKFAGATLRPTFFDFLAHRARLHYQNNHWEIRKPIHEFEIDSFEVFSPLENFTNISFDSRDTNSYTLKSLQLYQRILAVHKPDRDASISTYNNLARLRYVYEKSDLDNKDSLYLNALKKLSNEKQAAPANAMVMYDLARLYFQWGSKYSYNDEQSLIYKEYLQKAHAICSIVDSDNSYGGKSCQALKKEIEQSSFQFTTERNYLPKEAILFHFQFKEIDRIYFRIYQLPHQLEPYFKYSERQTFIRELVKTKALRTFNRKLWETNDFQEHSTELITQSLGTGHYIMLASDSASFSTKGNIAHSFFTVSNLSYLMQQSNTKDELSIYVLNRKNGKPLNKAKVKMYTYDYNYNQRRNVFSEWKSYYTNEKGYLSIKSGDKEKSIRFLISHKQDTLPLSNGAYLQNYQLQNRKWKQTYLFTDRAIYRPGQVVYFKGIILEKEGYTNKPVKNHHTEVRLINVNGEVIEILKVKSNQYGSYQGQFVLPNSALNGTFRIRDEHGSTYFSVEEYKRPTFQIIIDSSDQELKLNSYVQLSGNVQTYSGAQIADAQLSYRIIRSTNYWFWPMTKSFYPPRGEKEIASGNLSTNADGSFNFSFLAEADSKAAKIGSPYFIYIVVIDVSSPSGETQSIRKTISLSKQGIFLSTKLRDDVQLDELKKAVISATNMEGKNIESQAQFKLWKLKCPRKAYQPKYWGSIEKATIDEENYRRIFPYFAYKDEESQINNFTRDQLILQGVINCNEALSIIGDLKGGAYEMEAVVKEESGNKVSMIRRFNLYNENSKQLAIPKVAWIKQLNREVEPGDTAAFLLGTSLQNVRFLYEIEHRGKILSSEIITLSNEQRKISIPVKEKFRGNFYIHLTAVHTNRHIRFQKSFRVPFSNKKLNIQLQSFRNKVQPGSKEKWTLKILTQKDEGLAAELLIGMYDQSLDQFKQSNWSLWPHKSQYYSPIRWNEDEGFDSKNAVFPFRIVDRIKYPRWNFPSLNWFNFQLGQSYSSAPMRSQRNALNKFANFNVVEADVDEDANSFKFSSGANEEVKEELDVTRKLPEEGKSDEKDGKGILQNRSNFRETAFFYPQLRSDKDGNVSFEFEMPEALTQWKFRALAHTEELQIGSYETSIITQKELMVQPNVPRFFREGDRYQFASTVFNLSEESQKGKANISFYNAENGEALSLINGKGTEIAFDIPSQGSQTVNWELQIPEGIQAIGYKLTANSATFSDGEERTIPVLPKRTLVTESMPISIRGKQQKDFFFEKLLSNESKSLKHASYSLEFTSNPSWYAIQALPYLSATKSECSEQVFARLYANSLAEKIANSNPRIKQVFANWKGSNSNELLSKLEQNQELKSILIEETPWMQQAKNESEQKQLIALLFETNQMAQQKKQALDKLIELQLPNGGWSWFKGMRDNRYITQYIVNGFGHLRKLGVDIHEEVQINELLEKAIAYLDQRIIEDYERLLKNKSDLAKNQLGYYQLHYLYTRSFFPHYPLPKNQEAFNYYLKQANTFWQRDNLYAQGMLALALHRLDSESKIPEQIISSLKDNALITEAMGMYWKQNSGGYNWYQSSIETQALMIELFEEVSKDQKAVDELRVWLLKQKQTQMWSNSKATALACHALLIGNEASFEKPAQVQITVGGQRLDVQKKESSTGYFQQKWDKEEVVNQLGEVRVEKLDQGIAWGAAYWQYYEDLDQITEAASEEIQLRKKLYKVVLGNNGEELLPISAEGIQLGDKIRVQLIIESKRQLEFVHLKDLRASGFEPTKTLSGYRYQDGLGYYESTKDASVNYFFDRLPKGLFVLEYDLRANARGEFSNGISSIQCQYAPEFSAQSAGARIFIR